MTKITRGQFRNKKHHKLAVNIRLKTRGTKPTRAEVIDVMDEIVNSQEVPEGWRFAMIRWTHVGEASQSWRRGNVSDIAGSLQQIWPDLMEKIRVIGIVRAKSGGDVWEIEIAMKY
jgi:hypothetical protein